MNPQLERLLRKLGEAINESISDSRPVAEVIDDVKSCGYEMFVVLEVTVGLNKSGDPAPSGSYDAKEPELRISREDARFLQSMKIALSPKPGWNRDNSG